MFTVPVGEEGIRYEGGGLDSVRWGPDALTVAPDGTFWIADTAGNRLLHYSPEGHLLGKISLDAYQATGIIDLETTSSDILVLAIATPVPKALRLAPDGRLVASYDLPEDLRLPSGLTGVAAGDLGELWIEQYGGAVVSQLVDAKGNVARVPLEGYTYGGRLYTARAADLTAAADTRRGMVVAGDTRIEVAVPNTLAGLRFLGANHDGSFYVIVEEMISYPALQVDQTVRHYSASGTPLGLARVPIAEQYTPVMHGLAVGPDGAVYALVTRPDHAELQRLRFAVELEPILPVAPEASCMNTGNSQVAPLACRERSAMINTAVGYVNNQKYLNATNTDGSCPGRGKPRYIGGPGTYSSVSYDWGGFDTVSQFNSYMDPNTYQAGDIDSDHPTSPPVGVEGCSKGVDCSGFVGRCWGLTTKKNCCGLAAISCQLKSTGCLKQGDIMVLCSGGPGDHVILFYSFVSGGFNAYESTREGSLDRVVYRARYWSGLPGYVPRRYCQVCTNTCGGDTCVVQPSCQ